MNDRSGEADFSVHLSRASIVCPSCGSPLTMTNNELACAGCSEAFPISDGIPLLLWPKIGDDGVTRAVKSFYEEYPFPNYDGLETAQSLVERSRQGIFARLMDNQIPHTSTILEAGCGTGQLSNFLAIAGRTVFGTDICLNSLKLGQRFKLDNCLKSVHFMQMNLFRPVFCEPMFDIVISTGVLHHTPDPAAGFRSFSSLVKPGGHILIGLYNKFGRIWTDVRRGISHISVGLARSLDPYMRRREVGSIKKSIWWADQYRNPHESKHTYDEVLSWFDQAGFEYVNSVPSLDPLSPFSKNESLFRSKPRGTRFAHLAAQLALALSGGSEGGFFIVIGRRTSVG